MQFLIWFLIIVVLIRSCSGEENILKNSSQKKPKTIISTNKSHKEDKGIDTSLTPEEKLYQLTGEKIDPVDTH